MRGAATEWRVISAQPAASPRRSTCRAARALFDASRRSGRTRTHTHLTLAREKTPSRLVPAPPRAAPLTDHPPPLPPRLRSAENHGDSFVEPHAQDAARRLLRYVPRPLGRGSSLQCLHPALDLLGPAHQRPLGRVAGLAAGRGHSHGCREELGHEHRRCCPRPFPRGESRLRGVRGGAWSARGASDREYGATRGRGARSARVGPGGGKRL